MKGNTALLASAMAATLPFVAGAGFNYLNVPDLPSSYHSPDLPPGKPLVRANSF
jgi:hypothetical protein